MAKRSRKRSARSKKDNAGCMWGFISLFDFRHSNAPRKLLSDRKRGSGRHHGDTGFSGNKFELFSDVDEKQEDFDENGTSEDGRVDRATASVKSLMEEEMSKLQAGKKTDEEFEQPRSKLGYHREKNWKKISKNSKVATDLLLNDLRDLANLDSHQSHRSNSYEGSRSNLDLAAFMADFDGDNHQFAEKHVNYQSRIGSSCSLESNGRPEHDNTMEHDSELTEKLSVIQKALNDVAETFLSRKLVEEKQVTGRESVYQSKQFINALETLNANKELFLKFVQDPNSVLLKYIQDLQNAHAGMLSDFDLCKCVEGNDRLRDDVGSSAQSERLISNKMFEKQNGHSFFRKKEKPKETKLSKESNSNQPLNRITVLKPSPSRTQNASVTITPTSLPSDSRKHREVSERVGSYFSLKEIKRRLKHAIGDNKERRSISMDGVLHKIPYGQKSIEKAVPRKGFSEAQHTSPQPSFIVMKRDKIKSETGSASMKFSDNREPSLYAEAKKHLVEMLNFEDEKQSFQFGQTSKSLGRVLSLPVYSSYPRSSTPIREELSPRNMMHSPKRWIKRENTASNLSTVKQIESSSCTGIEIQSDDKPAFLETDNQQGNTEIVEMGNDELAEENDHFCGTVESNEAQPKVFKEMPPEGSLSSPNMPSFLLIHNAEAPENLMEKSDRPSPVSVLEPFFSEDAISPQSTSLEHDSHVQPQQHHREEHGDSAVVLISPDCGANLRTCLDDNEITHSFIRAVIEVSGLRCDEISDRLLEPSLLDEIEIKYIQLIDDPQLLFDCINEVLVEIHQRYFSYTPWMSLVRPEVRPIPEGINFIQEVCKGVDRHTKVQFPPTLDQLVGKDMDCGNWMELRLETENTITEIGDNIMGHLMEETILELWV